MAGKNIVRLAEEYCLLFHQDERRKGGNQDPYAIHPFAVRDILVRYGYDDPETQAIALLHDTFENTELGNHKTDIEKRLGGFVYEGVYVLSNNTVGKYAENLAPLFAAQGVQLMDERGRLTQEAYKLRLLFSRDTFKRVKIADMVDNTESLPDLKKSGIERKLKDADEFYVPLGQIVAPLMVRELIDNISNYRKSEDYRKQFGQAR